jgi:hypothetical protein
MSGGFSGPCTTYEIASMLSFSLLSFENKLLLKSPVALPFVC